jgi:nitrogen-specific signal transduction histidine kinase
MPDSERELVAELNHKINSPLAAIRYAMYLAGKRSTDPILLRYLRVAEDEVQSIADILRQAQHLPEQIEPREKPAAGAQSPKSSFSTNEKDRKASA